MATPAISLNRFDKVGLPGGGGGFKIPLVGGFGRLGAGEAGMEAMDRVDCTAGLAGVIDSLVVEGSLIV